MSKINSSYSVILLISTIIILLNCSTVLAANPTNSASSTNTSIKSSATSTDLSFIETASASSLMLATIAEMAIRKSSDDNIRSYAKQMITDYTRISDDIEKLKKGRGIQTTAQVDRFRGMVVADLEKLIGRQFERRYIEAQQSELDKIIDRYRTYSKSGNDQYLKQFASNLLLVLQGHKKMIINISYTRPR